MLLLRLELLILTLLLLVLLLQTGTRSVMWTYLPPLTLLACTMLALVWVLGLDQLSERLPTSSADDPTTSEPDTASSDLDPLGTDSDRYHDYCVIGAGPGGLQMGYFLKRAHRDYMIFERTNTPGEFTSVSCPSFMAK